MSQSHSPDSPRVLLLYEGRTGARCAELLAQAGVEITDVALSTHRTVRVVDFDTVALATGRPYPSFAYLLDRICWAANVPWTSSVLTAHKFFVGPTIIPTRTPCYECWSRRVRSLTANLETYDAVEALAMAGPAGAWFKGELVALEELIAALLAAEVVSLATATYTLPAMRMGRYLDGDAISGKLQHRCFARIGLCARCSSSEQDNGTWRGLAQHFECEWSGHE